LAWVGYSARMHAAMAFRVSAVLGFLGVALGAFGAHGLKDVLARHATTEIWHTAVLYHLVHAVVLLVLAQASGSTFRRGAWIAMTVGVLIFSGSLYVLAVTGLRKLGMVTPLGGVAFLIGWGWLAVAGRGRTD
jgi:uncharacterized membrane protein YgdD (TMEM256/DUF423 family)